ncbi:MAG: nucleotide exchange factor GrpE, partial [Chloroflexi bacterium]|nr:nucleotide exchange factor GrpE [Chloroflexota bacterium]
MNEEAQASGETPEATATEDDLPTLRQQLTEEREKAERYLGQWQRAAADLQNYKRRSEQERADAAKYAEFPLMLHLLPIADDLQRALDSVSVHLAGL